MLQWMGGSRRKVATSRKSTQKRQKQYFEQRKQQQQQQQAAKAEDILDEENVRCHQRKNNRSLDVLSLLNLSAIAQEHNCSCSSARDDLEGDTVTLNYQTVQSPVAMRTNSGKLADAFKTTDARTSSCYEVATIYPKKSSVNALSSHYKASKENQDRVDPLKVAKEHQLSVIELLGDDGPCSNSEEGALHEDHVAFSIEGLGKVVTETPVHSPDVRGRTISCGLSSPSKAKRQAHSIKNLSCGSDTVEPDLDSMMWDIDLPPYSSSMEQPSCSRGPLHLFCNQNSESSTGGEFPLLNGDSSNLMGFFEDDELFYDRKRRNENFWNASYGFQPNICNKEDYSLSREKWVDQMDAGFADLLNIRNSGNQDFTFGGSYLHKRRTNINPTDKPNTIETPRLFFQRQTPQNLHNFNFADETWNLRAGRSSGIGQVEKEPIWSFASEDAGESLSLLSEESCSSTAVRGDATKQQPSKSSEKHSFGFNSTRKENKWSWETTSANERNCTNRNTHGNEGNKNQWRRSKRGLNSPNDSNTMSEKNIGPDISGLFGAGYDVSENLSSNTFYQTPDTRRHTSPSGNLWPKDICDASPSMESHVNSTPIFKRPSDCPAKISLCSKFISEKVDLGQPFSDMCSLDGFLPNTMSGYSKPILSPDSPKGPRDWHLLNGFGSLGSAEKCSGRDAGKITDTLPVNAGKFESHVDASGSNGLSMETEKSSNTSESEEKSSDRKAPTSRTPEKKIVKATKALEDAEDTSSSVEIPNPLDYLQDSINEKECQHDTQISFPCQSGYEEVSGILETRTAHNGGTDPTCQILILESRVHQLQVQVLKEAYAEGSIKKRLEERAAHKSWVVEKEKEKEKLFSGTIPESLPR